MSGQIIDLHGWFNTPAGRYLLTWEQAQVQRAVADIFGYHALQLGLPVLDGLSANRMPHQWLADEEPAVTESAEGRRIALVTQFAALPFPASSIDMVVLPHTLEFCADSHGTLREVERVLVPGGKVVICGLNPTSLWGLRQRRAHLYRRLGVGELFIPDGGAFLGYWRLRDWLRLLSFEVETETFGCYRPSFQSQTWLERFEWMDSLGSRWWPIFGASYFLVAVKRVRGMHLLASPWKSTKVRAARSIPVANRKGESCKVETTD